MLLEASRPSFGGKRIAILARSKALEALLRGLLMQWNYTLLEEPADDAVLLAEEGCLPPQGHGDVLWLTRSRYEGSQRLSLPLVLEELWRKLESRYHKPPRNHIRISLQLPAVVQIRDECTPIQIVSLSDLGARFDFPRELVRGEQLLLQTMLDGEKLVLEGGVIYVVPRGDLKETGQSEIGMIFDRTPQETRQRVREQILCRYLALARLQIPEELFCQGLEFFQVPRAVLKRLGCLPPEEALPA